MKGPQLDHGWAASTWEGARDNTRRLGQSLTLTEKVDWLEAAQRLVLGMRGGQNGVARSAKAGDATSQRDPSSRSLS